MLSLYLKKKWIGCRPHDAIIANDGMVPLRNHVEVFSIVEFIFGCLHYYNHVFKKKKTPKYGSQLITLRRLAYIELRGWVASLEEI